MRKSLFKVVVFILVLSGVAWAAGSWSTNYFSYKPQLTTQGTTDKTAFDTSQDRVDARLAREVWVGDTNVSGYSTFAAAIATLNASGTATTLYIPAGTHTVSAGLTVNSNILLKPSKGALVTIADATLTINGGLDAGLQQVFVCTGTGKVAFAAGSNVTILPQWWGASPSASAAVNTAAIQASFTALADYTSWTLPPGTYACNAALTVNSDSAPLYGVNMDFKGYLTFDSCSGLDIRYFRYGNIKGIKVKRLTQAWDVDTTTADFGVRFGLCRRSNIGLDYIENFSYGFQLDGATGISNSYLTFNLGYIAECKYGQYVSNAGTGWNNECSYYGGQFTSNYSSSTAFGNVSIADNTLTHATGWPATFVTGFAVYVTSAATDSQTLPAPLVHGTTYYVIKVDATTIKLATSYANAIAGTAIDITTQGSATVCIGKAGSWAVKFASTGQLIDNHRYYNTSLEALNNGFDFVGYTMGYNFLLQHPRFERVANYIENAPRNLIWIQGASPLGRTQTAVYCPRMYEPTNSYLSYVDIKGSGYSALDSYGPSLAAPKASNGETYSTGAQLSFYNKYDLSQVTNLKNEVKDKFTTKVDDIITDMRGTATHQESYPLNKGFEAATAPGPAGTDQPMTYAKGAVVWNTTQAPGKPMGWVCSVPGSVYDATTIVGTGNLVGTTLTITVETSTKYLFPGCFVLIDAVQHQIKRKISYDSVTGLGVYEVYASIAGDKAGVAIAHSHPTWVPMANYAGTLPEYANNAAALGAGLVAGDYYRITGADTLGVVH